MLARHSLMLHGAAIALLFSAAAVVPSSADEGKTIFGANQQETLKAMKGIAQSLGVKCEDCHLKKGGKLNYKADTEHKKMARQMKEILVDNLAQKGSGEITFQDDHHQTKITAKYTAQGDAPGIYLTMTKLDQPYQKTLPLPAAGQTLSCMSCHNGQLHFLAPEAEHHH